MPSRPRLTSVGGPGVKRDLKAFRRPCLRVGARRTCELLHEWVAQPLFVALAGSRLRTPSAQDHPWPTSAGAYRVKHGRRRRYGGFYSTADVTRLVTYCEVH